uniref:Ig-like domain-containing protein n=1 Tax=Laticauda laticaudata TaxID=8630 RepID=A0A8C5RHV2_LATLA
MDLTWFLMIATAVPGTSVTLECLASGYDINRHHIHWITQPTETGLVYIGGFRPRDPVIVVSKFKGRMAFSNSGSTNKLRIDGLMAQDTAIYYCHTIDYKLKVNCTKLDCRKSDFSNRVVNIWNTLPDSVVSSPNPQNFNLRLSTIDLTPFLRGRSITLTCIVSGYDINNHHLSWIRQSNGKKFVFITSFRTGYTTYTANEFKGRVTPSTHGSTAQLRIDALKVEDTATYYCARNTMTEFGSVPVQYLVGVVECTVPSSIVSLGSHFF